MAHLRAALLNSGFAIILRVITFVLNAFILRHISGEVLGVINVRLLLLVDTIIFISREAFRKACLKKPSNGDWRGTINLVWLSVPIGIASSLIFGYIWIYYFDQPSPEFIDQYVQAVILVSLSAIGKSFSEALILASTNPQYDKGLFIDLPVHVVYMFLF